MTTETEVRLHQWRNSDVPQCGGTGNIMVGAGPDAFGESCAGCPSCDPDGESPGFDYWLTSVVEVSRDAWRREPERTCYSIHHCKLCREPIRYGERYHDGVYGQRAHVRCVEDLEATR